MAISKNDVLRVAHLARIDLSEDELKLFAKQLVAIVEFIDKLKELDVSEILPASPVRDYRANRKEKEVSNGASPTPDLKNVLRPDIIKDSLSKEAVLGNAPKSLKGHFLVPKIIE